MFGEEPTGRTRVPVIKVPGGSHVLVMLRCKVVLGLRVHWMGRRSYVCPGDDCPACEQHVGSRYSGLVAVDLWRGNGTPVGFGLLELTDGAYSRLVFLRESLGSVNLYGLQVLASRRRSRGPLRFDLSDEGETPFEARPPWSMERIADAAATLYGLPPLIDGMTFSKWEVIAQVAARRLLARAVTSLEQPA